MSTSLTVELKTPAENLGAVLPAVFETSERKVSAFDMMAAQPWAILPGTLETMAAIARRENEDVKAVEAKLGRPLQNTRTVAMRGSVAVVPVTGPVFRYANLFTEVSGATSLEVLARDFNAALADPNVSAIVLNIDSPGGQANGISEFAQMVRAANKPVVAYVDGQAASAAYWIASAAKEMVLSKTSEVGSIGAVVAIDTASKSDKVIEIVSSQSPKKRPDIGTAEGRSQIQTRIDNYAQIFIEDVAAHRGVSVEKVLSDFGQGDMRMGADAVKIGMADRVSTLEDVISQLSSSATKTKGVHMTATSGAPAAEMPVITREYLAQNHADIVFAIQQEGAAAERSRIQSVEAQTMPGHEALIASLKFDGTTTGEQAAVQVLSAERELIEKRRKAFDQDAPAKVPHAAAPAEPSVDAKTEISATDIAKKAGELVDEASKKGQKMSYAAAVKQVTKEQENG